MSDRLQISGRFILAAGTFCAVIVSFVAAAMILGPGARFIPVILLFLAFLTLLFVPLTVVTRPLIEWDWIKTYLRGMEKKVKEKTFGDDDLESLKKLKGRLTKKGDRRCLSILPRLTLLLSEMEKIEKARAAFFWEEQEGTMH